MNHSLRRLFALLVTINCLICTGAIAADAPYFNYLGIEKGLSNNSVRSIFRDHKGFMWFGTYDGLSRFDGAEFKNFRNKLNDSTSIPHNYIYDIAEDRQKNLWVATGQGIGIYSNLSAGFRPVYYMPHGGQQQRKIRFNVTVLTADPSGDMYIGTNGWGLLVYKESRGMAVQLPVEKNGSELTGYNVQALATDPGAGTWLFIGNLGLCHYDPKAMRISVVNKDVLAATCLAFDRRGNLWVGTSTGLHQYSLSANAYVRTYHEAAGALTAENIACIRADKAGTLWIGTEGGGINILEPATGQFTYLLPGSGKGQLTSESVFAIYEDPESRTWVGTLKGGINFIDPGKSAFRTIAHNPAQPNSLVYNFVSSFMEDREGLLWVGTDGGGISIWDREQNRFTNLRHSSTDVTSLSSNSVTSICQDYQGQVWVATFGGGINRFNRATRSFEHYRCINTETGVENRKAWILYEDRRQELWASTFGSGKLYRLNRAANRFEVFLPELSDLIALTEDRSGTMWAGNSHELVRIDRVRQRYESFEIGKPVRSIYEDSAGNLWVGTEGGGLILFDRKTGQIAARYSDNEGLCNNSVLNILEDGHGNLWLSTFNGLSRFCPANKIFKNYYQSDGLQSNQFLFNAALRLRSGAMVFGGINGFNLFSPAKVVPRTYMPPVYITGLTVNNQPVVAGSRFLSATEADQIKALNIPFKDAMLTLDFAALEFSAPGKIAYAYFLEGWDKKWNYPGNQHRISYTNLLEGSYRLRIKSTNADGEWNSAETILNITVLPPWYRSAWAYLLYALFVGGLIYLYLYYRRRQDLLRYEIKLANMNTAKEREMNERKLSFFTGVSHEFRTPLTLIINPVKDLIRKSREGEPIDAEELNIVYRNARRLLSLVDQLLLFRKAEAGADKLKVTRMNVHDLGREVYLAFTQKAQAAQIDYRFECANTDLELFADREKMEIMLYNLISNALKFTPAGGQIGLKIEECSDCVAITVADTGCGIPKEVGPRLFERFYQIKDCDHPVKSGFGIGLYLVRQSVESHKGTITYDSECGKGTTFRVQLPKGAEHFEGIPIFEEASPATVILDELVVETPEPLPQKNERARLDEIMTTQAAMVVADDNEQIRTYVANLFRDQFRVFEAGNGQQALELVRKHLPDIVISDVMMPELDGIGLCRVIKEDAALNHIPVVLLTSSVGAESRLKGVEGGADDYLTKPFEKDLLLARVSSLLKSRDNLQKYFYNEVTLQQNHLKISVEYKEFLDRCIAIVEQHLDDTDFNIKILASELGMSHSNLYKRVKSISGQSVNAFIRFIRLRKAAELFINTPKNVNETAAEVGFNDIKYFREQFSKLFGMNPSDYIKKYRKAFGKSYTLKEGKSQ